MHFILRTSLFPLLFLTVLANAQTTYTWNGGASGDYQTAANWKDGSNNPRTTPAINDILNIGGAVTLTNVPSEEIGGLIIPASATVTLKPAGVGNALSIGGTAATNDFSIASGSSLTLDPNGNTGFVLELKAGAAADIAGTLVVQSHDAATEATSNTTYLNNGTTTVKVSSGTLRNYAAYAGTGTLTVNGTYEYAYAGSQPHALPTATWGSSSTLSISGDPQHAANWNQTFRNLLWKSTTQVGDFGLDVIGGVVNEIRVESCGSGRLVVSATGTPATRSMAKISAASTGKLVVSTAGTAFGLTVSTVSLGSGQLIISDGSGAATLTVTSKVTSSTIAGALILAKAAGDAMLKIGNTGSSFIADITSPGAGIGSVVFNGSVVQPVAFGNISSNIHIGSSNTTGITFGDYPAGNPLDISATAGYTKISGAAAIGDITNAGTSAKTVEFNGSSLQTPTFGTVSGVFTVVNNNSAGVYIASFPAGCNLQTESGKTTKITAHAVIDEVKGAGTIECNGNVPQFIAITTYTAGNLKVNNVAGVAFNNITVPAGASLLLTDGAVTGITAFDPAANLYYNGSTPYIAGNELMASPANIYLQNNAGVNLGALGILATLHMSKGSNSTSGALIVMGDANFTGGTLTIGSGSLQVGGTMTSTNARVVGALALAVPAGDNTVEFPLGTASTSKSVTISFTGAAGGTLTCSYNAGSPGTSGLPLNDGSTQISDVANGYWSIVDGGALGGGSYDITFNASGISGLTDFTSARLLKRDNAGADWTEISGEPGGFTDFTMTGLTSFSEFGVGVAAGAFPVELASFDAAEAGAANVLDWITASEQNSAYFEVDRSVDGENGWTAIGRVEAAGNSESLHYYTFSDLNPLKVAHYRLRMVDMDGAVAMSEIRSVTRALLADNVSVGPVPVSDVLTISVRTAKNDMAMLRVFSCTGDQVLSTSIELGTGQAAVIDLSKLAAGAYRLVVSGAVAYEKTIIKL